MGTPEADSTPAPEQDTEEHIAALIAAVFEALKEPDEDEYSLRKLAHEILGEEAENSSR